VLGSILCGLGLIEVRKLRTSPPAPLLRKEEGSERTSPPAPPRCPDALRKEENLSPSPSPSERRGEPERTSPYPSPFGRRGCRGTRRERFRGGRGSGEVLDRGRMGLVFGPPRTGFRPTVQKRVNISMGGFGLGLAVLEARRYP
jgi:hypothetical protein